MTFRDAEKSRLHGDAGRDSGMALDAFREFGDRIDGIVTDVILPI
jgi:hypothetical protein